jgi:hypothetical protein
MKQPRLSFSLFLSCLLLFSFFRNQAQPLFMQQDPLQMQLKTDILALLADRVEDSKYVKARLSLPGMQPPQHFELKVKTRGNFRLKAENCQFPPLKLNFDKDELAGTHFSGQNKLKLVTHCSLDEYILKEYLVYRLYQILTPYSFRVRLAKVNYQDEAGAYDSVSHYAFLIEDDDDVAERMGGYVLEDEVRVAPDSLKRDAYLQMAFFMYMVGNRDWDIYLKKNVKVMQREDNGVFYALPYDFDFCGFVDAPYTLKPLGELAESLELRKFRKNCWTEAELQDTRQVFLEHEEALLSEVKTFHRLSPSIRRELTRYLKAFYKELEDPRLFPEAFMGGCG